MADIQKSLADKHAVLAFYVTSRRLYGFLMNNQRCTVWQVVEPTRLLSQIKTALRDMGQRGDHQIARQRSRRREVEAPRRRRC